MPRNDQPFLTFAYNTDQFTDPYNGMTVHDDGTTVYVQPQTNTPYIKQRFTNGLCAFNISNVITLRKTVFLTNPLTGQILYNPITGEPLVAG